MSILLWLAANWRIGLMIGAGVMLAGLFAHDRLTARALDRQKVYSATLEQQLSTAVETNQQNLAEIARLNAEHARVEAALAESADRAEKRSTAIAKIRKDVSHVAPSPSPVGPAVAAAVDGLRQLKAARSADQGAGREGAHPGAAADLRR